MSQLLPLILTVGTSVALLLAVLRRYWGRPPRAQLRADEAEEASIERYELIKRGFTLRWQAAARLTDRLLVGSTISVALVTSAVLATTPAGSTVISIVARGSGEIATTVAQDVNGPAAPSPQAPAQSDASAGPPPQPAPRRPSPSPITMVPKPAVHPTQASGARTNSPSPSPSASTAPSPAASPSPQPSSSPSPSPSASPSPSPTPAPSPTGSPSPAPVPSPSASPTP